jgi:hypothetical protein
MLLHDMNPVLERVFFDVSPDNLAGFARAQVLNS